MNEVKEVKIKINDVYITNFRNITELHISFKDGITELNAENGVGKTNTLSAILWCLFGKNIFDEKLFAISPIINGEEKNEITTNVKLILNDNYIVSRTYYKRTSTLQTGYLIDDKEELNTITQSAFAKEFEDKFVNMDTFKSLSNINYLPNLHWKDLKELILNLVGDIDDEEILLRDDFGKIEEQIRLMGAESTKKSLNESNKEISQSIVKKESEYQTLHNTKEKYVLDQSENAVYVQEKEEIERALSTINSSIEKNKEIEKQIKENEKSIQDNENEMNKLHLEIHSLEENISEYDKLYSLSATDIDVVKKQEENYVLSKIDACKNRIDQLIADNESYSNNLKKLKEQGEELRAKEMKVENDTCSTCGQKLPEEKINETLERLKQQQIETLNTLKDQYDKTKIVIESNEKEIELKKKEVDELNQELEKVKNKIYDTSLENDKQKEIRLNKEHAEQKIKELVSKLEELANKAKELKVIVIPELEVIPDTTTQYSRLNELNNKLASTITLNKIEDDIKVVLEELEQLKNNKILIQQKLELVSKFNNIKSELLRERIKSNFKIADFKVKEFTQDGVEQETFKICVDGVDFNELNNGMKILVAIDLIIGIQNLKKIHLPIIIDNVESLTSEIDAQNTQLIVARATKGKKEIEVV